MTPFSLVGGGEQGSNVVRKHWYPTTTVYGVITQKATIRVFTAWKPSSFAILSCWVKHRFGSCFSCHHQTVVSLSNPGRELKQSHLYSERDD
jgi:hypothetical protein